jgi:large subunit ribosomal protein L16
MLLFPRKTKYKKNHKDIGKFLNYEHKYNIPKFGFYALKLKRSTRITTNQIEAARKVIRKRIKKKTKERINIAVFTDKIATKKSSGVRMGKGKGNFNYWYTIGASGRIIYELSYKIHKNNAVNALKAASSKFPVKCKIISRFF